MVLIGENEGTQRQTCVSASLTPQIPCELLRLNVVLCTLRLVTNHMVAQLALLP